MRGRLWIIALTLISLFLSIQSFVYAQPINKSISLGPYPTGDRYYLRVFNVDDVSRVRVNGRDVLSIGYYQEREIDITGYLREGQNTIELILENTGGGWTYGYVLRKGGNVIWSDSCGSVGKEGCNRNDQTKGIVARHVINLAIQQPLQQQDRPPNVTSFSVSPREVLVGQAVRIGFSVRDDVGLQRVELWRKDYDLQGRLRQDWREIRRQSISGREFSGSFEDRPSEAGVYEYGLHVVDSSGKWNCERNSQTGFSPGVYGPIKVVVQAPAEGKLPKLQWPLVGELSERKILLSFGNDWTWGYCNGRPKKHTGIDIKASPGEPVFAADSGIVREIFSASKTYNWGEGIVIEHNGFTTVYIHVIPKVSKNSLVYRGQEIAVIANIEGPHLHFGIRKGGFSEISKRGALPQVNSRENIYCQNDPLFPENFIDPLSLQYEVNPLQPSKPMWPTISPTPQSPKPEIISDLKILEPGPYRVGQTITAEFTIQNSGNAPITFDVLTVGGRLKELSQKSWKLKVAALSPL